MSLTDELIADLEELDNEQFDSSEDDSGDEDQPMEPLPEEEEEDDFVEPDLEALRSKDVTKIAKLYHSKNFQDVLKKIAELKKNPSPDISGPIEQHPEYKLIVQANKLSAEVDNEISVIHKFIRDIYAIKFPELESLVLNPLDYARVVQAIGNSTDISSVDLSSIIPPATVMVVTVTASTTNGQRLSESDLKATLAGCDLALKLDQAKRELLGYVEGRMTFIAPNLTAITGSAIAAKLMGTAGGLTNLSKMPACNILLLGTSKKNLAGFSTATQIRHVGFIFNTDIIQQTPPDLRQKAARSVAGKCALAARVDSCHEARDGSVGQSFVEQINKRLDKLQELAPGKQVKALPVPLEAPKKRRGGRRARKMKEKYVMTEYRKMQNRMAFGAAEEDESMFMDKTKGIGMSNTGKIRAATADSRTKVKAKPGSTPAGKSSTYSGVSSTVSGLASSVVFTPVKGFEINNPNLAAQQEKVRLANEKYFSNQGFLKVGKKDESKTS